MTFGYALGVFIYGILLGWVVYWIISDNKN